MARSTLLLMLIQHIYIYIYIHKLLSCLSQLIYPLPGYKQTKQYRTETRTEWNVMNNVGRHGGHVPDKAAGGGEREGCKLIPIDVTDVTRQPIKRSDEKYLCKQCAPKQGDAIPKGSSPETSRVGQGFQCILTHNGGEDEDAGEKVGNHK